MRKLLTLLLAWLLAIPSFAAYYSGYMEGYPAMSSFNAESISNLALWLKSSDGITLDSTLSRDSVATWANQASTGSGYNAAQSTKANQPTYVTNCINGLSCLRFDGTNYFMSLSGAGLGLVNNLSGMTVFVVWSSANTGAAQHAIFASTNGGSATTRARVSKNVSNNTELGGRKADADSQTLLAGSSHTVPIISTAIFDYANTDLFLYKDGTLANSATSFGTGTGNSQASNSTAIAIGASGDGSQKLNGDIAEIIVYQKALSASERQLVERYLGAKYAITVAMIVPIGRYQIAFNAVSKRKAA